MKAFFAKVANYLLTKNARKLSLTGCWLGCHREDAPDELFN